MVTSLRYRLILARLATVRPPRYSIRTMRSPEPLGLHEQLPEADLGRCRTPRCRLAWLWYQRSRITVGITFHPAPTEAPPGPAFKGSGQSDDAHTSGNCLEYPLFSVFHGPIA